MECCQGGDVGLPCQVGNLADTAEGCLERRPLPSSQNLALLQASSSRGRAHRCILSLINEKMLPSCSSSDLCDGNPTGPACEVPLDAIMLCDGPTCPPLGREVPCWEGIDCHIGITWCLLLLM